MLISTSTTHRLSVGWIAYPQEYALAEVLESRVDRPVALLTDEEPKDAGARARLDDERMGGPGAEQRGLGEEPLRSRSAVQLKFGGDCPGHGVHFSSLFRP